MRNGFPERFPKLSIGSRAMYPSFAEPLVSRRHALRCAAVAVRLVDIALAGLVLLVAFPIMALIGAAVLCESGRPIFFSQIRLGQNGRQFRLYKFRKFAGRSETSGSPLTIESDPRLTRLGAFLARTKLDELPQLWNIVKGDMAIVGPRPESLAFADCFTGSHRTVLDYKPGIFGPSQVLFRNEATLYLGRTDTEQFYRRILFPLKAQIDLAYFQGRTLPRDLGWIIRGTLAVFRASTGPQDAARMVAEAEERHRTGRP